MKKSVLAGIIVLALILSLPAGLNAQELEDFDVEDLVAVAGFTYNTFNEASDGPGIFLGAGMRATPEILVAGQYERFFTADLALNGIAGTFAYDFSPLLPLEQDLPELFVTGGLGYYFGNLNNLSLSGMGVKIGAGAAQEVADDIDIRASLAYRVLDADVSLSGFEVSAGISYDF